jgi:hypothetical protein
LRAEVANGAAATVQAASVSAIPVAELIEPWLVRVTVPVWEVPDTSLVAPEPRSLPLHALFTFVEMLAAEFSEERQVLPPTVLDRRRVPL